MEKRNKKLVTHNGSFHADDVFACATLSLMLEKLGQDFEVKRTRDEDLIKNADYVFDVGGIYDPELNRFDHHQKGGSGHRDNGIEYSSFGLVWKHFGNEITGGTEISKRVDEKLVQIVDAIDNGMDISSSVIPNVVNYGIYDIVATFHPSYKEINPDHDSAFLDILIFAKKLLQKEIEKAQDQEEIHQYIFKHIDTAAKESGLLILDEYIPRVEIYIELINYPEILFVVSPGSIKMTMWKLITLRKDMNFFENRKDLPAIWGGLKDEEFSKASGVSDVVFCHRALFLAVTKTKEAATKLAELALLA
ncbi:MAG: MYG1 family protein [bacterium]